MKEKVIMKSHEGSYYDSQVLVSRKKVKNKDYVFMKLAEFELSIPSRYLSSVSDAIRIQFIICSELLKLHNMSYEQAQLISALMTQEFKMKKKKLVCYEA